MNRRLAVRHLTILAGTAALLPGCLSQTEREQPASVPLKHLALTARDETLLAEVCETLLPRSLPQPFEASTAAQRTGLLQRLDQQPKGFPNAVGAFYRAARQLTIDGYVGSQFFMTKEVVYELVPSRYHGYFPVSQVNLAVPGHGQSYY